MKFYAAYFGCRTNQAEMQEWIDRLEGSGYELTSRVTEAEFGILHTCCVTEKAERDVHRFIRSVYKNTRIRWFVTGCAVTNGKAALGERYKNFIFLDNAEKERLAETITEAFPLTSHIIYHSAFKSRIFLKIQDGCNFRCAFCIVPRLRGKSRSLKPEIIREKAARFAALGYHEIVLTGINLSSYGYDLHPRQTLLSLLETLQKLEAIDILRLSSLDPRFVKYSFVKELSRISALAPSFHFALQSGSDSVLRRMHRGGKADENFKILGYFREFFPDANLGADIIVGFPGETEKEFADTQAFIEESPLNYLHIFPFSPRPGTKAECLEPVSAEVMKRRLAVLKEINYRKKIDYREGFKDKVLEGILIEETPHYALMTTRNYLALRVPPLRGFRKRKIRVRLSHIVNENLCEGEIV